MMTRNAEQLDQQTFANLMKPWIHNSTSYEQIMIRL